MIGVAKKKPPPPRPLKCSSLSSNKLLKGDSEALLEPIETSGPNGVRIKTPRMDSVFESNEVKPDLEKTSENVFEDSTSEEASADSLDTQTPTGQLLDDALFIECDEDHPQGLSDVEDSHPLAVGDDESVDNRSAIPSDNEFRDKLMDVVQIILSVDSRLKSVEKKFHGEQLPDKSSDQASEQPSRQKAEVIKGKLPERIPCIPQMRALDWYNFKHKWTGDKAYAIEVLRGPAKYYQDGNREERSYEEAKKTGNSPLEAKWGIAEKEDLECKAECTAINTEHERIPREAPGHTGDDIAKVTFTASPKASLTADETSRDELDKTKQQSLTSIDPLFDGIEALRDLRCLKRFFETYIHPTVNRLRNRTAHKITFADLWYLFPHGEEVFIPSAYETEAMSTFTQSTESSNAYQSVYRVYELSGGRVPLSPPNDDDVDVKPQTSSHTNRADPFHMMCYHIDWNSKSYAPVSHEVVIEPFDYEKDITSLEVYPTGYHKDFESIRQQLEKHGRKFLKLTNPTLMSYYGRTYSSHPCGGSAGYSHQLSATSFVDSEVMVDFEQSPYYSRPDFGLEECPIYPRESIEEWDSMVYLDKEHNHLHFYAADSMFADEVDESWLRDHARKKDRFLRNWDLYLENYRNEPIRNLERSRDLVLLPSRVMGYSIRDQSFNALNIENLEPFTRKSEGFDDLELPEGHRELVEALVNEHLIKKEVYEKHGKSTLGIDIVSGKGTGLVMLLHGLPGVGKTSTAECVAQSTGRPLFSITCGTLGLEPGEVEKSLTEKFRLAAKWNCVMLLDEADIFLTKRDKVDLRRNALVSVFLRVLEYYEGILFLTTNRVGVFDDAFKSRIHASLFYPALTKAQTIKIWANNLDRLKRIEDARAQITEKPPLRILDGEILAYAVEHYKEREDSRAGFWNGRQIRNAFLTAAALAYHRADTGGPVLTTQVFKRVAMTMDGFDRYMNTVHGEKNEEERAYNLFERIALQENSSG
ncbi:hypothetical protein KCU67_g711, partial [Aureobasidium melanogenum]